MRKIYLIDGNNFIYRMFFALPEFKTRDGEIVNALFGMAKFFAVSLVSQNPDYIIFIKDSKGKNFRHDLYEDYKATRDKMPDNLRTQIPLIEQMISEMNIPLIEIEGCEADDVIGTLAIQLGKDKNNEIDILTGDKDLHSLVTENVHIMDTMKKKIFGPKDTEEKFGVKPEKIIDYLAIVGDSSDNIPGIDGFGPQKALLLINNIGGVDEIYKKVEDLSDGLIQIQDLPIEVQKIFQGKTFEKLKDSKEKAFLSKQLATIKKDVCFTPTFNLEDYKFDKKNLLNQNVIEFFKKYEFNSLVGGENGEEYIETKQESWKDKGLKVYIIDNDENLLKLKETLNKETQIVLDTETTGIDYMTSNLVGISIYIDDNRIYYINRLHGKNKVSDRELKGFIKDLLNSDILIIGHNIKFDLEILELFLNTNDEIFNNTESSFQTSFDF